MAIPEQRPLHGGDSTGALGRTDRLLSAQDLASYLGIPVQTVYTWRHRNTGPRGFRVGRHLRFHWRDVQAWLAERMAQED